MNENNKEFEQEYDSLKDVAEFQKIMYNPGYYIGTGRVPPIISAPGNATPLAVLCFFAAVVSIMIGLFSFFSNVNVASGLMKFPIANKIIVLIITLAIALLFSIFGFSYAKKAKRYYTQKAIMENEQIDETVEDKIWQHTCPKCGTSHDMDYPKCPNCKFRYNQ